MKVLLIALLLQHAVISARAGLVTYVRNIAAQVDEQMGQGVEIRGQRGSRFEAMLTPDTYVRMRNDSAIVLESEALDRIVLRRVSGAMIIDVKNIDGDIPIRVRTGDMEFSIGKDGVYLFEQDRASVLDGEMRFSDSTGNFDGERLKKEWTVGRSGPDQPLAKVQLEDLSDIRAMPLVRWSEQRTRQLTPEPTFIRNRNGRRFRF